MQGFVAQGLPYAVGCEDENIAGCQFAVGVIDGEILIQPHCALQHMAHVWPIPHMIGGELLQAGTAQAINAAIAHMHRVISCTTQHQRGQSRGHVGQLAP